MRRLLIRSVFNVVIDNSVLFLSVGSLINLWLKKGVTLVELHQV